MGVIGGAALLLLFLWSVSLPSFSSASSIDNNGDNNNKHVIELKEGPYDVAWIVQLSDLHFSVHHPERAADFNSIVGPTLAMINPSLVLVTGDLTDGKSKDMLTMKQDKEEWLEYKTVMDYVVKRSSLKISVFYDLRGNHDNFGVPVVGGSYDFFSAYSFNGQLKRSGAVNSITIETGKRKILFVGFDSTMSSGLRGPTNLFGHPTDSLLDEMSSALSQWDSQSAKPVTKISYGHFPISFSAASSSGKTLKDTFLKHSLSAYLCGHLHSRFGKNLKRHHSPSNHRLNSQELFQLNAHRISAESSINCSSARTKVEGFWEWEMGDWRKSRAMRILAIDRGQISFLDIDFKLGTKKTIILPTFPLDSRFTSGMSFHKYKCQSVDLSTYGTIRSLVFSTSLIVEVVARIYDSRPGDLVIVLEEPMTKLGNASFRGDLYAARWNFKAFEDPSPERYWLQIEATDIRGRTSSTELRPFSINGLHAELSWSWREFFVMGCQWAALYYPLLYIFYLLIFSVLLIPKAIVLSSRKQFTYNNFKVYKSFISGTAWFLTVLYNVPLVWFFMVMYLLYLIFCPWLYGQIFTGGKERGYMTYRGWVVPFDGREKLEFLGYPDIMVVVLPHLLFVVLPSIIVIQLLAAERETYRDYLLSVSAKKEDDSSVKSERSRDRRDSKIKFCLCRRFIRNFLLLVSFGICWKHFKNCRALMKAYEMNPVLDFPIYCLSIPLLLAYTFYKTRGL